MLKWENSAWRERASGFYAMSAYKLAVAVADINNECTWYGGLSIVLGGKKDMVDVGGKFFLCAVQNGPTYAISTEGLKRSLF